MLIYEYKLRLSSTQQTAIDAAIRTAQFVRNKALRMWMDGRRIGRSDLQALCAELARDFSFAAQRNSTRWRGRRRRIGPGKPLPASTTTARQLPEQETREEEGVSPLSAA